ncbi:hypothetical protein B0H17DRAFT_1109950 [Mycena rosella]|uniref:Uncharacterized protein n=1 Tax=Mycena rosella TaxID=1033263 RepID=A0AAD7FNB4_MYCRO|nr:hypothetical protein B0H17DRAFT_1109950 [Mycena rosella]
MRSRNIRARVEQERSTGVGLSTASPPDLRGENDWQHSIGDRLHGLNRRCGGGAERRNGREWRGPGRARRVLCASTDKARDDGPPSKVNMDVLELGLLVVICDSDSRILEAGPELKFGNRRRVEAAGSTTSPEHGARAGRMACLALGPVVRAESGAIGGGYHRHENYKAAARIFRMGLGDTPAAETHCLDILVRLRDSIEDRRGYGSKLEQKVEDSKHGRLVLFAGVFVTSRVLPWEGVAQSGTEEGSGGRAFPNDGMMVTTGRHAGLFLPTSSSPRSTAA